MGTRSDTLIFDCDVLIASIYRQFDGYPTGHGKELIEALGGGNAKICNGFSYEKTPQFFNGMGCLAAHLVSKLKDDIGGIYLSRSNPLNEEENKDKEKYLRWHDYTYVLKATRPKWNAEKKHEDIYLDIYYFGELKWSGLLKDAVDMNEIERKIHQPEDE